MDIKAIIGLGNPGPKFYHTRHNIGFQILDFLAEQCGSNDWRTTALAEQTEVRLGDHSILLIKPQTYMNDSGKVVPHLLKQGIKAENILVVHDELEIPFGQIKLRQGGSARGHNGLRSIISVCGPDFWRLRVGIGRPSDQTTVADFVLQRFTEPSIQVKDMIEQAITQIKQIFDCR